MTFSIPPFAFCLQSHVLRMVVLMFPVPPVWFHTLVLLVLWLVLIYQVKPPVIPVLSVSQVRYKIIENNQTRFLMLFLLLFLTWELIFLYYLSISLYLNPGAYFTLFNTHMQTKLLFCFDNTSFFPFSLSHILDSFYRLLVRRGESDESLAAVCASGRVCVRGIGGSVLARTADQDGLWDL